MIPPVCVLGSSVSVLTRLVEDGCNTCSYREACVLSISSLQSLYEQTVFLVAKTQLQTPPLFTLKTVMRGGAPGDHLVESAP